MGQTSRRDGVAYGFCDRCGKSFERVAKGKAYKFCSRACSVAPLSERFFEKVDASDTAGCWPWTGKRNSDGYGELQQNRKSLKAHRIAFEIATSAAIPDGMEVCHTCDNPACCQPGHLFLGSHTDNMRDMASKGRGIRPELKGEAHGAAKLTASDVRAIRRDGRAQRVIGESFRVSQQLVSQIKAGKVWTHIEQAKTE